MGESDDFGPQGYVGGPPAESVTAEGMCHGRRSYHRADLFATIIGCAT
jgi:hypothetical protein